MNLPILTRGLAIAAVAFAILLPISMIGGKIAERQGRAQEVVAQFASETSGPQLVVGPLLALTCQETFVEERQVMRAGKAETVAETKTTRCPTAFFSPRRFAARATMPVETRHRGIYSIGLYRAELEIDAQLAWPEAPSPHGGNPRAWKQAYLVTYVRDPRGIKAISASGSATLLAGPDEGKLAQFAVREHLGDYTSRKAGTPLTVSYRMSLVGTSSLQIAPVGDANEIRLRSDWPHPSFGTAWSPDERSVTREGFEASWRIASVATGGEAAWNKAASEGSIDKVAGAGVSLFDPVNIYALSYRATEYAFLFVLFTFGALALTEAIASVRLHAMQYALVGSAIAVFFLLLLALSEHLRFSWAYATAASACVLLLTFYLRHPLGTLARAAAFFGIFVGLYGSLYVLLLSEDSALLLGSLMVFFLLAVAMIATRRLDWGAVSARMMALRPVPGAAAS
jgi:inner membrane protein